jgi:1,4-alpha-glucan branching enzyme
MSIKKDYITTQIVKECKVTFKLEKEACEDAAVVNLVGDFNDWDKMATPLKKQKDGSFKVSLILPTGNDYQYRYIINNEKWENDRSADKYASSIFEGVDNSVVIV